MVIGFVLLWIGLAEANQKEKNKLISDVPVGLIVFDGILTVIVAGIEVSSSPQRTTILKIHRCAAILYQLLVLLLLIY